MILRASIDIDAPIDRVFQIMLDFPQYSAWNPFVIGISGEARQGAVIWLDVRFHDGQRHRVEEHIEVLDPPGERAELTYQTRGPLARFRLVRARRRQVLTRVDGSRTRYETDETFSGLLTAFLPRAGIQRGFDDCALALKQRAERAG